MRRVRELLERGVPLGTTDRNANELERKLIDVFGLAEEVASRETARVLDPLHVVDAAEYEHARLAADQRLSEGGKSDWPALAAALALEGEIWSEDHDFFGVGVPVWSTPNVRFVDGKAAA